MTNVPTSNTFFTNNMLSSYYGSCQGSKQSFTFVCFICNLWDGLESFFSEEFKGYVNFANIAGAAARPGEVNLTHLRPPPIRVSSGDHGQAVCLLIVGSLTPPPSSSITRGHFSQPPNQRCHP